MSLVLLRKHVTTLVLIALYTALTVGAFCWLIRNDRAVDDPVVLVEQFIEVVKQDALQADRVDWIATRTSALSELPKPARDSDAYRAYKTVLYALGDKHTVHLPREVFQKLGEAKPAGALSIKFTTVRKLDDGIVQMSVRAYESINSERSVEDGLAALAEVEAALPRATCGLVVDLSENTGGNMFPMFIALMPLLGDGTLMNYVDRHGKSYPFVWNLNDPETQALLGAAAKRLQSKASAIASWNETRRRPIAVIQSELTSSSGEATLIAMRGREFVRTFGRTSAGYATSNKVIALKDGSGLALTVARMADRNGRVFIDTVEPDVRIDTNVKDARNAAIDWVKDACATRYS
jgi:carboxyl-terminal processing protease